MANTHTPAPQECWSADEECFRYDSLGELLDSHDELEAGAVVYFGEAECPSASRFVDASDVIDRMASCAYDEHGEYAEDFPDVSKESEQELEALLTAWAEKHCTVTFWSVKNVKQYTITAEDLAEHDSGCEASPNTVGKPDEQNGVEQ